MPAERAVDEVDLLAAVRQLDPPAFEEFVADLYRRHGHDVAVTGGSRDDGLDVAVSHRFAPGRTLVQIKRHGPENKLRGPDVQQYSGLYAEPGYVRNVVIITSGPVTNDAEVLAARRDIELVDEDRFAEWLLEMDPQLQVIREYIDLSRFVAGDGPPRAGRPALGPVGLVAVAVLVMLVTVGGALHVAADSAATVLPVLSGTYLTASVVTVLGTAVALRGMLVDRHRVITVLFSGLMVTNVGGLVTGSYWWSLRLQPGVVLPTASLPGTHAVDAGSISAITLPTVGLGVHLTTAVLLGVGLLWARQRLGLRLRIDSG